MPRWRTALFPIRLFIACALVGMAMVEVRAEEVESSAHGRVLLVADKPSEPFAERLRAEVSAIGFQVVVKSRAAGLEAEARAEHAVAAIRVLASRRGVEVWMADAASGRSMLRQVIVDESPGKPDHGIIALQTVELLRTGLFPKPEPKPVPETPPPPPPPPASPSRQTACFAGVGVMYSPGGVAAAPQVFASVHQVALSGFGLALDLGAAYRGSAVSGPEGSSDIRAFHGAVAGVWQTKSSEKKWVFTTGAGLGVMTISAWGKAAAPLTSSHGNTTTGLGYVRAFAAKDVQSWLSLGAGAWAGSTLQHTIIRFAGNQGAVFGMPILGVLLVAEIH